MTTEEKLIKIGEIVKENSLAIHNTLRLLAELNPREKENYENLADEALQRVNAIKNILEG